MKRQLHNPIFLLGLSVILLACLLSACGAADTTSLTPSPTTVNVEAIYTAGAQTMIAQLTGTAAANPTATPTPSATITPTGTITPTPTKTLTQYVAPLLPLWTSTTTGTPGTPGTPTPTPSATFGAVGCNDSAFLSNVTIPDGTTLQPDAKFVKTWSIKNTGTCSWTYDYKLTFIGGDLMNSDTFKIRRTVGPNLNTEISVDLTAPSDPGTYTGYWRMANDSGILFGASFVVSIKIAGATYTPPPAASTTPVSLTETATPEPLTATPQPPTATLAPLTATPQPPTATRAPLTATPRPPTATRAPLTATPQPPTKTAPAANTVTPTA